MINVCDIEKYGEIEGSLEIEKFLSQPIDGRLKDVFHGCRENIDEQCSLRKKRNLLSWFSIGFNYNDLDAKINFQIDSFLVFFRQ